MANNQTFRGSASLNPVTNPLIINQVSDVTPNTAYSISIPDGAKRFMIKSRTPSILLLSYDVAFTDYITVGAYNSYSEENIIADNLTIHLKCSVSLAVTEVVTWS